MNIVLAISAFLALLICSPGPVKADRERLRLKTDDVSLAVIFEQSSAELRAGQKHTIEIEIAAEKAGEVSVELDPVALSITSVKISPSKRMLMKRDDTGRVQLSGMFTSSDKARAVIELELSSRGPLAGKRVRNRLTVTLKGKGAPGIAGQQTSLSWPVKANASAYVQSLRAYAENVAKPMKALPAQLTSRVGTFPGKHIFKPPVTKLESQFRFVTKQIDTCVRRERRRVRINGKRRWRRVCVQRKDIEKKVKEPIPPDPQSAARVAQEMELAEFIQDYVSEKGSGLEFAKRRGRYFWTVRRLPAELQTYMTQQQNDAICTGAPLLIEYYRTNTRALLKRTQKVFDMRDLAVRLARQRAKSLGITLIAADRNSNELLRTVLRHGLSLQQRQKIEGKSVLLQLRSADRLLRSDAGPLSRDIAHDELRAALGAIEAVVYAEHIAQRYKQLDAALFKPMDKIAELHKAICMP